MVDASSSGERTDSASAATRSPEKVKRWLRILLVTMGAICLMAVAALLGPRSWIEWGHAKLGLGPFPEAPIAEYLARSVSALCAFYGGLLCVLACDVRRHVVVIRYQALAIMLLSALGIHAGVRAGLPAYLVIGDALGCWMFLVPIWLLALRVKHSVGE